MIKVTQTINAQIMKIYQQKNTINNSNNDNKIGGINHQFLQHPILMTLSNNNNRNGNSSNKRKLYDQDIENESPLITIKIRTDDNNKIACPIKNLFRDRFSVFSVIGFNVFSVFINNNHFRVFSIKVTYLRIRFG